MRGADHTLTSKILDCRSSSAMDCVFHPNASARMTECTVEPHFARNIQFMNQLVKPSGVLVLPRGDHPVITILY